MPPSIARAGAAATSGTTPPNSLPGELSSPELLAVMATGKPIARGVTGSAGVKRVQKALGFAPSDIQGVFGPKTEAALKLFQKAKGLPLTGQIDRATLLALAQQIRTAPTATSPAAYPFKNARFAGNAQLSSVMAGNILGAHAAGDGLKSVQRALEDMGFAPFTGIDGQWGAATSQAIKNFQANARTMFPDVKPTGLLDMATMKALDALAEAPGVKGQTKNIPTPTWQGKPLRTVVSLNEHRTFLYDDAGKCVGIFPNAVGKGTTPTTPGYKVVTAKLDQDDALAAGQRLWPDTPKAFGARILDLSWADGRAKTRSGEELHGTEAPDKLGYNVSHGCMRHRNQDIITLWNASRVGDHVAVVESIDDRRLGAPRR